MCKTQIYFLIPVLLLGSCQREQEWGGAPDINATVESEQNTRTSLSVDESGAGTIYWNPSDQIDVFFGTKKAQYTSQNAFEAIAATFKTNATLTDSDVSSTNIWGLYPSNGSSSCNGSSITTTLPSTQYGVPNTFDQNIFPAVAHSSSKNLQFYNVCGGIKFNLAYDDIKKITFRGNNNENLAGKVSISFVDGLPKATIVNGVKEITLTPKTDTTFTKGKDYYFILLPVTLSAGFTMTFTATDGTTGTLNYTDKSVTIMRSIFGRKGNVDAYASFDDSRQQINLIYYTSSDGSIVQPSVSSVSSTFGCDIVSNEYVGSRGVIIFDNYVSAIGEYAFENNKKMRSIAIPSSVTDIGTQAFYFCTNLSSVSIPNNVRHIGDRAFQGCWNLKTISLPTYLETIESWAFSGCGLTSFVLPKYVFFIEYGCLSGCTDLVSIAVESGNGFYDSRNNCNAIIETTANQLIAGCKNTIIPNSVSDIYAYAFSHCSGLTSIDIPSSVTSIGMCAFYGCSDLTSITVHATTPPSIDDSAFNDTNDCPIYVPAGSVDAYKSAWSEYADRIQAIPDTHEAVDLGLSVKWATCNVGTDTPEGYGDYFAWGETEPKSNYSWSTYEWCNGSNSTLTKYCNNSSYGYNGFTDNKTVLDLEDDVAYVNWGGSWRIPTDAEWTELQNNCTWTWTTLNGVNGYRVTSNKTGYTDKSIFIPAAGCRFISYLSDVGARCLYWSSSLYTGSPNVAWSVDFNSGSIYGSTYTRCDGLSVRPVYGDFISVESISLNKSSLSITEGETSQLSATVSPSTATAKTVSWSSSNTNVATVSYQGVVTAVSAGTATITVWSSDGQKSATCTVTVAPLHEAVDLGLSVKWATCNVGADTPEGYGDYFAWGETEPKSDYSWSTYKWCNGTENTLTKYCNLSSYGYDGFMDFILYLEQEDDAAHVNWGGLWRVPTNAEWAELRTNCTWTWTTLNGVNGYRVTSNKIGYTEKSIFLPAAGWSHSFGGGTYGDYWATSIPNYNPSNAFVTHFESSYYDYSAGDRCDGLSIRPVTE